jgi:hypothetical protein
MTGRSRESTHDAAPTSTGSAAAPILQHQRAGDAIGNQTVARAMRQHDGGVGSPGDPDSNQTLQRWPPLALISLPQSAGKPLDAEIARTLGERLSFDFGQSGSTRARRPRRSSPTPVAAR